MKNILLTFVLVYTFYSCTQDKRVLMGNTQFQKELNADYKDATTSPLTKPDRKKFKGLDFFQFDSTYVVQASFKRTPDEEPFKMKTTTDRLPIYVKYGELSFSLKGKEFSLNIYQDQSLTHEEGFEDYLFLPFLDETNGLESYGGGRYVDARIPEEIGRAHV